MPDTITQQLNEVFQKASLSFALKTLTSIDDFETLSKITQNAAQKLEDLNDRFDEEYKSRVETERQRLYREGIQTKLDHPAPPGAPSTDNDTITWQAHRNVRLAHDADLRGVADEEQRQIEDLLARAHERNQTQGSGAEAFLRARDQRTGDERRSGQDRRIPKQSQD
ncbi:hypothetical protein GOZ96_12370 [Agrobacterium vitis]|uniref:Uncharacterized protein n=1 Tax=Agrobacterium vitis TaxID=373 RepID=A0A368NPE3_AGRVI|nr:hypothetical protein [Agrobacterium vitis]KAA3516959.1 hypothetical protein DXM22_10925 [Agrobacterium vitis]KAA3529724.1 hypothetical protein DXT89_08450 [Agrobacterium vitis]MUZ97397.1 hypothetical protein [Agrobacterium vitis]NOJ36225.1 hypothetical protein [Agrobacterium vitis]RCU52278.1 hypothetical protein ASB66_019285 [Agrobacterium vitis]